MLEASEPVQVGDCIIEGEGNDDEAKYCIGITKRWVHNVRCAAIITQAVDGSRRQETGGSMVHPSAKSSNGRKKARHEQEADERRRWRHW